MKNLTEEQIRKNRDEAINEIKKRFGNEKFEIIDSYFKEYTLKDASINTTIYCLGRAILKLSDADLVVFVHREYYYSHNESQKDDIELIIAKNRNGKTGLLR